MSQTGVLPPTLVALAARLLHASMSSSKILGPGACPDDAGELTVQLGPPAVTFGGDTRGHLLPLHNRPARFDMDDYMKAASGPGLFFQIAGGVAVGIVVAAFAIWQFWQWQLSAAAADAAADLKSRVQAAQAMQQREEERVRRAEISGRQAEAASQRAAEARKAESFAEDQRREQAWARFYSKPLACDEAKGGAWTVQCANDFIRAKRAFAAQYGPAGP